MVILLVYMPFTIFAVDSVTSTVPFHTAFVIPKNTLHENTLANIPVCSVVNVCLEFRVEVVKHFIIAQ